jgi:hypothetical protein
VPLFFIILLIAIPPVADAADGMAFVELNGGYLNGDFGTTTTAEMVDFSLGISYETDRYDVGVSIPYVSIDETSGYSASGLGDILLRSSVALISEDTSVANFRIGALLKTPTADTANELGTGEFDVAGFLGVSRHFSGVLVNVVAGYLKAGDSDTVNYDDVIYIGIGAARMWNRTGAFVSLDQQSAPVSDADFAQSASLGLRQILAKNWIGGINASLGLSTSAPDYGAGVSLSHGF